MKTITIFTNRGKTYFFQNIENFTHTTQGIRFDYVGKATGVRRACEFNNTSMSGWAIAEEEA